MKKAIDSSLFALVHDFFKVYLPKQKKRSPNTIRSYQSALESLFDFVKTKKQIRLSEITFQMIDCKMVSEFLDKLEIDNGCSTSTRNHRLRCIRSFYAYAANMEATAVIHQAEIKKVPIAASVKSDIVNHMSEAAVKAILEQPDVTNQKGLRNQFLMILLYDTAARIQEIMDIQLRDIHLGTMPTVTLHGKGSKIRNVPLMPKTLEHFQKYTDVFHSGESLYAEQYLFYVIRQGQKKRITEDNIRRLIKAYGIAARKNCPEVPANVHPHLFRHYGERYKMVSDRIQGSYFRQLA